MYPCISNGRDHGECAKRVYPTSEEMAADERETDRIVEAIGRNECPDCGVALEKRRTGGGGYVARCPAGCAVDVRSCGRGDVGAPHR